MFAKPFEDTGAEILMNKIFGEKLSNLVTCLENIADKHPYIVIMLMHEVERNLYPSDPFIESKDHRHTMDRVGDVIENVINIAQSYATFGSYSNLVGQEHSE